VPACGWTDDLQLGYIYTGTLKLVSYIYLLYILLLSTDFYVSGLFIVVCHRIIAKLLKRYIKLYFYL
jgi:hypothetical protein